MIRSANALFTKVAAATLYGASLFAGAGVITIASSSPAAACGGLNQKACAPWKPGPVCNKGLKYVWGKCKRPKPIINRMSKNDKLRELARGFNKSAKNHIKALDDVRRCMASPRRKADFRAAVKAKNVKRATQVASSCLTQSVTRALQTRPKGARGGSSSKYFNTLSIGVGAGAIVLVGVNGDAGIVIDLNRPTRARFYTSGAFAFGKGGNVGADLIVGLSRDKLAKGRQRGTAVAAAGKYLGGAGVAINFDKGNPFKTDVFDGFAISGGVGAGFEVGTIHLSRSRIW